MLIIELDILVAIIELLLWKFELHDLFFRSDCGTELGPCDSVYQPWSLHIIIANSPTSSFFKKTVHSSHLAKISPSQL